MSLALGYSTFRLRPACLRLTNLVDFSDSYQYLRTGKDLSSDKDLVTYFREVISLREKIENIV